MEDFQIKAAALDFALRLNKDSCYPDVILKDAQSFYEFLKGKNK